MPTLTPRQRREREFFDRSADEVGASDLLVEESFEAVTALENRFILRYLGPIAGRRILDIGAGAGEASLFFASRGAHVTAVDISPRQLGILTQAARDRRLDLHRVPAAAEDLPFRDETFDIVYGYGVLHHVDYCRVIGEVRRVLRPGGRAVFTEPIGYNPLIRVYRRMAAAWRTPDERPFSSGDMRWVLSQFTRAGHREFWLTAQIVFLYFWLGEGVAPSADRYWKRVLRRGSQYAWLVRPLVRLDDLLGRVPGVRLLAYNTVLYGERA